MSATRRELLEARWDVLMRSVQRFNGESDISIVNSKRQRRISGTIAELAAMLVDEVYSTEVDSLGATTQAIWADIERRLLAWAEATEAGRVLPRILSDNNPLLKGASA